jgi:hypothetical protein
MPHAFISYCRDNGPAVKRLHKDLGQRGLQTWIDVVNIGAGDNWKNAIRKAIEDGAAFVACFSRELENREHAYAHREIRIAIEKLQEYPVGRAWFIPVKLDACDIPDHSIGGNDTLRDLNFVDLSQDWDQGVERIFNAIRDHCKISNVELQRSNSPAEAMKRIWAALYPVKCSADDLLNEVSEVNLMTFTDEFFKLKVAIGAEMAEISEEEYTRLDSVVKDLGRFRLGKRRLSELRKSRDEEIQGWEFEEMKWQIKHNVETHRKFIKKLKALRSLYDSGKTKFAAG